MWPHRIAVFLVLVWGAFCLTLAGVVFYNFPRVEGPERYLMLLLGLAMLYMGGSMLLGLIWPAKQKDPVAAAEIEVPPLDQVRGRTSYRDQTAFTRNMLLVMGTIFLLASLSAAGEAPIVLVISVIAVGILAGAGVMIWRQIQYGRAGLELAVPARRGDMMQGVITMSGFGWSVVGRELDVTVWLRALRTFRGGRKSTTVTVASALADAYARRNGNDMTITFTTPIPKIDTREGRYSWSVELELEQPRYRATFDVDVA
jgi:hypothetical protein